MKKLRRVCSILLSIIIILSALAINNINSDAMSPWVDYNVDDHSFKIYMYPYGGLRVNESIHGSTHCNYVNASTGLNFTYEAKEILTDKSGNRIWADEVLKEGETYHYFVEIYTLKDNGKTYSIGDCTVNFRNGAKQFDKTFYTNPQLKKISDNKITFECDIMFQPIPVGNLGTMTIDLTKGDYVFDFDTDYYRLMNTLFNNKNVRVTQNESDKSIVVDIDNDGNDDFEYRFIDGGHCIFRKLKTNSIPNIYNFEISSDSLQGLDKYEHYYTDVSLIFNLYDLSKAEISGVTDKNWTGSAITQSVAVKYDGKELKSGQDYNISYKDNTNPGTASIIITGTGLYTGTVTKTFKINKTDNGSNNNNNNNDSNVPVINGTVHGNVEDGLWVELPDGSYPKNQWGIVNGKKYYFDSKGYAASNEYADGKWFNLDGSVNEAYSMVWKSDANGWWIEDKSGWYPVSKWLKIDGCWYYFTKTGYMDYSEYRDGCWLGADGAWVEEYYGGHWSSDSYGWWYEDATGWYPVSQWVWIDGVHYYFNADGYLQ